VRLRWKKTVVLRTMPTSQNRDMGHPVLGQALEKMVVLRTMPTLARIKPREDGAPELWAGTEVVLGGSMVIIVRSGYWMASESVRTRTLFQEIRRHTQG